MNVLRSLTFSVAFYGKIASFSAFEKKSSILWKNPSFFLSNESHFLTFSKNLLFPSLSGVNLLPVAIFLKTVVFENPSVFRTKAGIFHCFEKSNLFNRILQQICYIERFFTKINVFFRKPTIFSIKKSKAWTLWEVLLTPSHSTATSLPSAFF